MLYIWNTPIVANVEDIVLDLKRETGLFRDVKDVGNDVMVTCPFHKGGHESKPSFGISKEDVKRGNRVFEAGTCHCYTCGWTGGLAKLVGAVLGKNEYDGFKWLVNKYTYGSDKDRAKIKLYLNREEEFNARGYIDYQLEEDGQAYLRGRKLSDYIINMFGLGQFGDFITFPIYDRKHQFKFFKRRNFKTKDKGKRFLNDKGVDKSAVLYGLDKAIEYYKKGDVLYLTEGEIDTLTLWTWGEKSVAIMSADISEQQIRELINSPYRTLMLALDNDVAGRKGKQKIKDKLIPLGFKIYTKVFPEGKKDINELEYNDFKNMKTI